MNFSIVSTILKKYIKRLPIIGGSAVSLKKKLFSAPFNGSGEYWEARYAKGGSSGAGSRGILAEYKAEFLNKFVEENSIASVIEFGCGDGTQLALAEYPGYLGVDISQTIVEKCHKQFGSDSTKHFLTLSEYQGETAELSLSLDVIYHLVEDEVYESYMGTLFAAATRFVVVYSSNTDTQYNNDSHVKNRKFLDWVNNYMPQWCLAKHIPNKYPYQGDLETGSIADFYVFRKNSLTL